ncbi:MAG: Zn-dependent hydrolase [Rhodospirillaceae bacterium]|nr:Zn-dependent hydrolase [Rhodospirillaceae bacterium]MYH35222.1 Zn-dependent hydrolase [Rhodospirillaceae bacterium]MYK16026.1 Zn-dependent hydrolase [Rhodospirillaceae bacterium]MYK58129.1 Zn-dependent hydrolase [Rhodospirillaceae bacterium]
MADDAVSVAAVVEAVREDRLWQRHMDVAAIGATGRGGVNRQALTPEDGQARRLMLEWASELGFTASVDAIGNLFIRRAGAQPTSDPVVAGSHLDSQPTGGNFDGVFGVLAALEVLEAANDAGVVTGRPMELVVWTNEEGARFQPATMGSAVHAGALQLETVLASRDSDGVTVEQALTGTLEAAPVQVRRDFRSPMAAYVEAHIEQGPVLESTGNTIGVVTGIQGLRWFQVEVGGEEAHAGTTPRSNRRDALAAAVAMVTKLQALMFDESDTVRFTVGRFEVAPNSPNTIPGRVVFTIDFRHPDQEILTRLGDRVEPVCRAEAQDCTVKVVETMNAPPTEFDPDIRDLIRSAARRQALPHMDMTSGATHDAKFMAGLCPSGMIFVPCEAGVSHNEAENASAADLAAGARVLAEVAIRLANR